MTVFIQFPVPPPPASGNHQYDLFFYEFNFFFLMTYYLHITHPPIYFLFIYFSTFLYLFLFINLFIFWLHLVFISVQGLSLFAASRAYSSLWCAGFSLWWFLLLQSTGSRHAGFSSCGTWAQLLHGMWDLPGQGLEPMSLALTAGFLTTVPPGKSHMSLFVFEA